MLIEKKIMIDISLCYFYTNSAPYLLSKIGNVNQNNSDHGASMKSLSIAYYCINFILTTFKIYNTLAKQHNKTSKSER